MDKQASLHQLMTWWGFHFLATMNNAAMNIHLQVFIWAHVFSSLGYIASSELLGHGPRFNILRNHQTVIQCGCTILHCHQQCMGIPVFSCPRQHWLLCVFCIITILVGMNGIHCGVDLNFTNDSDVEHLFLCLLLPQLFLLNLNYLYFPFFFLVLFFGI